MPTSVKIEESREVRVARENKKWEKKYNRVNTRLKNILFWVLGTTALAFALPFLVGSMIAWADPNGWDAYRVGLMMGGIFSMFVFMFGLIAAFAYLGDA